jgi:hypothetical protein
MNDRFLMSDDKSIFRVREAVKKILFNRKARKVDAKAAKLKHSTAAVWHLR